MTISLVNPSNKVPYEHIFIDFISMHFKMSTKIIFLSSLYRSLFSPYYERQYPLLLPVRHHREKSFTLTSLLEKMIGIDVGDGN